MKRFIVLLVASACLSQAQAQVNPLDVADSKARLILLYNDLRGKEDNCRKETVAGAALMCVQDIQHDRRFVNMEIRTFINLSRDAGVNLDDGDVLEMLD